MFDITSLNLRKMTVAQRREAILAMGWLERYSAQAAFRLADVPALVREAYRQGIIHGAPIPKGWYLRNEGVFVTPLVPAIMVAYGIDHERAQDLANHANCFQPRRALGKYNSIHFMAGMHLRAPATMAETLPQFAGKLTKDFLGLFSEILSALTISRLFCLRQFTASVRRSLAA